MFPGRFFSVSDAKVHCGLFDDDALFHFEKEKEKRRRLLWKRTSPSCTEAVFSPTR